MAVLSARPQQTADTAAALCRLDRVGSRVDLGGGHRELVVAAGRAGLRLRVRLVRSFLRREEQACHLPGAALVADQRLPHVRPVPDGTARRRADDASWARRRARSRGIAATADDRWF